MPFWKASEKAAVCRLTRIVPDVVGTICICYQGRFQDVNVSGSLDGTQRPTLDTLGAQLETQFEAFNLAF